MLYLLMFIPSAVLFLMIYVNVSKARFSKIEMPIFIIVTVFIMVASIFLETHLNFRILSGDIIGNIGIAGCVTALAYKKTKWLLLSGHYAATTMIIGMIGGTTVNIAADYILGTTLYDTRSNLLIYALHVISTFAICYPLSKYIGNFIHKTYTRLSTEVKQKFARYGLILSVLTYVIAHINVFLSRTIDDITLLSSIDVILIIGVFFVALTLTAAYSLSQQKESELAIKEEVGKNMAEHTIQLEDAYSEMKKFRHDYRNLLSTLMGYDNLSELKEHLGKSLSYAEKSLKELDSVLARLSLVNIPELKGLIAAKCAHAQANGIKVEVSIAEPVYNIPLDTIDMCRIAGILLDNAIDELIHPDTTPKLLKFSIVEDEAETLFICTNPYRTEPAVRKIFDEGYSTKGSGRGLGLATLKKICEANKNAAYTVSLKNKEFSIIISIRQV